jgi:phosphoribosyl 1,2-cyclic phosphodiesterase
MHKDRKMTVTFWGVRGSYPQCKPNFDNVGGHTSCVGVEVDDQFIFLDAGTGMINAGEELIKRGIKKATLLISHAHADHISGLAFFKPLHSHDFELTIIAGGMLSQPGVEKSIESILSTAVSPPYFPIPWYAISCKRSYLDVPMGSQFMLGHLKVSTIALDHPGGSAGYRLEIDGKSICYISDTGHKSGIINHDLVEFIQSTNMMIYDATFTEEEFAARPHWGHSTWNQAVALSKAAAIEELALYHHDPEHDDAFMASLESQARAQFSRSFVARQGMIKHI